MYIHIYIYIYTHIIHTCVYIYIYIWGAGLWSLCCRSAMAWTARSLAADNIYVYILFYFVFRTQLFVRWTGPSVLSPLQRSEPTGLYIYIYMYIGRLKTIMWRDDFWWLSNQVIVCLLYTHSKTITWWDKWLTTIASHDSFNFPIYTYYCYCYYYCYY